jgi:hypothetical protein
VVTELISADALLSKTHASKRVEPRDSGPGIAVLQLLVEESKYIKEEDYARACTAAID